MEDNQREIHVCGLGAVTCLGASVSEIWSRLCRNQSGIGDVTMYDTSLARSSKAGQVRGEYAVNGHERMKEFSKQALRSAIQDSGLSAADINRKRSMLVIGTSLGHMFQNEEGPVMLDDYVQEVLEELGLEIPYIPVSSACSSGTDAIAIGADLIKYNGFEFVLCGGVDVLDVYKTMGHSSLKTLAASQCMPFSDLEFGTTLGEGAGFIALRPFSEMGEESGSYAVLDGYSNTTDTISVTNPDIKGGGAVRLIKQMCKSVDWEDICYINAHGSGTETNDQMEYHVYQELFAESRPFLSSTKGAFGHTLGATGAIEAIVTVLALNRQTAPPTVGCDKPDPCWMESNLVCGTSAKMEKGNLGLSVTYGFGGANAGLLFRNSGVLRREEKH